MLFDKNTIEVYIKLVARDVNVKYPTSQEAYFSFVPSIDNDFYPKKTAQSYVIDGYGYIELAKKYKVMSIPNMFIVKDGEIVRQMIGFRSKEEILEELESIK